MGFIKKTPSLANLPRSKSDIPFLGYKKCFIDLGGSVPFLSLNGLNGNHAGYNVVSESSCAPWYEGHDGIIRCKSFDPACECGFYAFNNIKYLTTKNFILYRSTRTYHEQTFLMADLLVELYGTVVVYSEGFRASHQRVLKLSLDENDTPITLVLESRPNLADELQEKLGIPVGLLNEI